MFKNIIYITFIESTDYDERHILYVNTMKFKSLVDINI
jgi:hypothetical protein